MKTTTVAFLMALPALFACQTDTTLSTSPITDDMPMEELMENYMELAKPGEFHAKLTPFIGDWSFETRMRMAPDAPWTNSTGTMSSKWVLGGRYMLSSYSSESAEIGAFEGLGLVGYDNAKQRYVSTWIDTWGTMIPPAGEGDMEGNVLTMENEMVNPVTGRTERWREVTTLIDANHYSFEMYAPGPDGELYRNLEIQYTRR